MNKESKMSNPSEFELISIEPRDVVVIEGRNTRFDYGNIEELADSIRENGMKQPCKVQIKNNEYQLIDGHRRLKACMELVKKGYDPVFLTIVVPEDEPEDKLLADMIVANDGKHFSPLEEAMMLQKLRDTYQWSQMDIAKKIGKSLSHVSNRIALLNADESIKEALVDGTLKTQEALAIVRKSNGDKDLQKEIIERTKGGEKGIVEKELLRGRFNKEQWEAIHSMFISLNAYSVSPKDFEKYENSDNPEVMEAYVAGCFQGVSDLAFTSMEDFYEKVKARVDASSENAIIKPSSEVSKVEIVEEVKEPEKKKPAKKSTKVKKENIDE